MKNLGTSDAQERIPGMSSAKIPLLIPLVIYNMYLKTTSPSSQGIVLLNLTFKTRAHARPFMVCPRSVSILADRGRVTPRFRLKERPCLAIFQTIIEFIFQTFPIIEFVFFRLLWPARNVSYITLCGYPLEPDRDLEVSEEEVYIVR